MPEIDRELFIRELRKRPAIWDVNHSNYPKQMGKSVDEIAELFGVTAAEVKSLYRNLRTYYVRERRKIDASISSGTRAENVYKPCWKYFNLMSFIEGSLLRLSKDASQSDFEESRDSEMISPTTRIPLFVSCSLQGPILNSTGPTPSVDKGNKLCTIVPKTNPVETLSEAPKILLTSKSAGDEDLYDHFGATIAAQIRGLPSQQLRSYAMMKVQQVIYEVQYGTSLSNNTIARSNCSVRISRV